MQHTWEREEKYAKFCQENPEAIDRLDDVATVKYWKALGIRSGRN